MKAKGYKEDLLHMKDKLRLERQAIAEADRALTVSNEELESALDSKRNVLGIVWMALQQKVKYLRQEVDHRENKPIVDLQTSVSQKCRRFRLSTRSYFMKNTRKHTILDTSLVTPGGIMLIIGYYQMVPLPQSPHWISRFLPQPRA